MFEVSFFHVFEMFVNMFVMLACQLAPNSKYNVVDFPGAQQFNKKMKTEGAGVINDDSVSHRNMPEQVTCTQCIWNNASSFSLYDTHLNKNSNLK